MKWRPNVTAFTRNFIEDGLRGRPITRNIDWGINVPLPGWDDKKLYVWFEAVMGYFTASVEWAHNIGKPDEWKTPDQTQATIHAIFVAAIYDGVARAARDWLIDFLKTRKPANLGAALATLPRAQEIVGGIEARLAVNARLIDSFDGHFDADVALTPNECNIIKLTVTNNAVAAVEEALSLAGNHGLSRTNPLERHYRDVLCGRVHTPQDDSTRLAAGRLALGI